MSAVIARVFPRKTEASPVDPLAYFAGPGMFPPECDEVHVSCSFTYDREEAERLADQWANIATVKIGGPAYGDCGHEFTPGRYLKPGYVITSRGCPNRCWFCDVWKREGAVRELEIKPGWNVLDSNLLACSEPHIRSVFEMLAGQGRAAEFTGGLEAARLEWWHVDLLWDLRPSQMFFAYDTPDDYEPLLSAGEMLRLADFTRRHMRAYVLIGYPKDSIPRALVRLVNTWRAGFMPMAMLWRDASGKTNQAWRSFQREWARPAIIRKNIRSHIQAPESEE